ncbi:DNA polymerase III, gamma and tau subunits [Malaciobacter marinus]|uniref:DNA polymerase III subunit gamma/tau n=1 Tax=Malaciobacter marinus TaxID=505249 RepID=A0A347TNF2_9BACT|nr:DNA polymerase III subunit gamma/tau [Malaciobacter marinus]AXX88130.1 DNA polymerase III, gamma and tau subunits [Malaciobacter marinus]PHO16459.1 DNA polymerase III subunit gamma/tau [Malaciobacter marinus]
MSELDIEKKVLALKYRPKRFEDLVGQSTISQTLSLALDSNRLSHAYLFSGLRGSGKTSTARIMAKALLCTNGPTSKPCEVCENCQSANSNRHLDIIEMDAASNRGIDDIKDLIEHTKYKPSSARFKVFIIDEVHMLTTQAFNALLKTLEEPPGFVKFILATTDPLKLPATILSRTQHFRFNKISNADVIHHLSHILNEENIDYETEALEILSRSGQGSLRDTLTLLDQAIIFSKGKVNTISVVEMLGLIEPKVMDEIFDIVLNKKDITNLVKELENYEISQVCDEITIYLRQKMLEKDAKFDLLLFDRFFRVLGDAKHLLALNSDASFVLILTLLKMQEATNLKSIQDIINQVEQIEVQPAVKDAISKQKVLEHAQNDTEHVYEEAKEKDTSVNEIEQQTKNEAISNVEQTLQSNIDTKQETKIVQEENHNVFEETKIQEPNLADTAMFSENTIPLDSIDAIPFETPFDDDIDEIINNNTSIGKPKEEQIVPNTTTESISNNENSSLEEMQEPTLNENVKEDNLDALDEAISSRLNQESDPNEKLYDQVINRVYDRDVRLGECFEDNFVFKSFEANKLEIISYAKGEERKFLFKHFGILKTFIYDVFGDETELDFIKDESEVESQKKKSKIENQEKQTNQEIEKEQIVEPQAIEEDLAGGSGCVATMHNSAKPEPSQQELQINDILNSKMLNKAKELFDIKKITVKTKT